MSGNKGGRADKGYLYHLLADGAGPFRYRSRVRALLGFPEYGGVQMNFSKPLSIGGFSYVVPRFRGEFEFPDDLVSAGSRSVVHGEEIMSSTRRTSGEIRSPEPPSGRNPTQTAPPRTTEHPTGRVPRTGEATPRDVQPRQHDSARGGQHTADSATANPRPRLSSTPEIGSKTESKSTLGRPAGIPVGHSPHGVPPVHDVTLPGTQARRKTVAHDEDRIPEKKPANPIVPEWSEQPADPAAANPRSRDRSTPESRSETVGDATLGRPGVPVGRATHVVPSPIRARGDAMPDRPVPEVLRGQGSPGPVRDDRPAERIGPPRVRTESRSNLPHLRTETIAPWRPEQTVWDASGLPYTRRPNRANHQERPPESHPQSSPAASNPMAAAPAAQTTAIVVQPGASPGVTPPAFWERRHLTTLRLRIRR